jgi:hypothetical protein
MTRCCPSCRTNGADYDDPQGLCADCVVDLAAECRDEIADEWERDLNEWSNK